MNTDTKRQFIRKAGREGDANYTNEREFKQPRMGNMNSEVRSQKSEVRRDGHGQNTDVGRGTIYKEAVKTGGERKRTRI